MNNPLFDMLGGTSGPFGNMSNVMQQFNQFRSAFRGDPKAQVEQLLQSGQMSQEQFRELGNAANQLRRMLGK